MPITSFWQFDKLLLKSQRRLRRLSLKQLAALSGVSFSYISKLERGDVRTPTQQTMEKLATALGLQYGEFVVQDDLRREGQW